MIATMTRCRLFPSLMLSAALSACWSAPAAAQLRLPSLNLPQMGQPGLEQLTRPAERLLDRAVPGDLSSLRLEQVRRLLERHPVLVEPDPRGAPAVRREILAGSPSPEALRAALALGMTVLREQRFEELGEALVVLRAPEGLPTADAIELLRALDPGGVYDFNHLYSGSGSGSGGVPDGAAAAGVVGLIDSGVDASHPVFEDSAIERFGCDGATHPAPHGTAVAALMVGRAGRFEGAAPAARLYAADIYCDSPTGGSAERIVAALAWMARRQVGVVNISLVGPANATLGRAVAAMVARGHLLVAAVGNDGPAAPPLYPASYPGVVGVTGVDRQGRALPEAAQGPQVMFAAPGSQMVSAAPGKPPYRQVRGTSFAAPLVAALLSARLPRPDRQGATEAVAALARQAVRPEPAARDALGYGVVGAGLRMDPSRFR